VVSFYAGKDSSDCGAVSRHYRRVLQQRLVQAEQEQLWLAERVSVLEAMIGKPGTFPDIGTGIPGTEAIEESENPAPVQTFRTSVEALIATGIPTEQSALIQSRLDEYDLKQLYIKDRASREGWLNTARYRKEQRQAQTAYRELRSEVGDDAYDRMLYALGQSNRVVVRDIMQNSSAEQYGLQANDRVSSTWADWHQVGIQPRTTLGLLTAVKKGGQTAPGDSDTLASIP